MTVLEQVVISFLLYQPLELEGWTVKPLKYLDYCSISFNGKLAAAADKNEGLWIRSEFLELANAIQKKFNPKFKWKKLGKFEFGLFNKFNSKPNKDNARLLSKYAIDYKHTFYNKYKWG